MITRYVFEEVKAWGEKSGKCVECGKRRTRKVTMTATVNPFNVDENGDPKDKWTIQKDLYRDKVGPWKERPIICKSCAVGTLWHVRFWVGNWTIRPSSDHAAIGEVTWHPKNDMGHAIVHAHSEDEAMGIGKALLTKAMQR